MFSKRAVIACVAALVLGGCGGEAAVEEAPTEEFDTTAQAWPPTCVFEETSYNWFFYDLNGVEVGRHECRCGVLTKYGKQTSQTWYQQLPEC